MSRSLFSMFTLLLAFGVSVLPSSPVSAQEAISEEVESPTLPIPNDGITTLVNDTFASAAEGVLPTSDVNLDRWNVGYANGEYIIERVSPQAGRSTRTPVLETGPTGVRTERDFGDTTTSVDVRFGGDPSSQQASVACRGDSTGSQVAGYQVTFAGSNGTVRLLRFDRGQSTILGELRSLTESSQAGPLHLVLGCVGSSISFGVEGIPPIVVQDRTYRRGQIWLGADSLSSSSQAPLSVHFHNLLVTAPLGDLPGTAPVSNPDAFGYTYRDSITGGVSYKWVPDVRAQGGVITDLQANNALRYGVPLPFQFPMYGQSYERLWISTNGVIGFSPLYPVSGNQRYPDKVTCGVGALTVGCNERLPATIMGGAAIAAFWDDLNPVSDQRIAYRSYGASPNRSFVVEWDSDHYAGSNRFYPAVQAILREDGTIVVQYAAPLPQATDRGAATIGIQNETNSIALSYAYKVPVATAGLAIEFDRPPGDAPLFAPTSGRGVKPKACLQTLSQPFLKIIETLPIVVEVGCPVGDAKLVGLASQPFQGGDMLWRGDSRAVLVSFADQNRWASFPDGFTGTPLPAVTAPDGFEAPQSGFGKIWREREGLKNRLGWAYGPEQSFDGAIQEFDNATVVYLGNSIAWNVRVYNRNGSTAESFVNS